jgi:hypothetical protein
MPVKTLVALFGGYYRDLAVIVDGRCHAISYKG